MTEKAAAVQRKSYDSFDLFKFIASIVVVMAHTRILGESRFHLLHPWIRIAIPVFFMVSAFLFFSKYDSLPDAEKKGYLWKFVKRDLILYLFWFVVFLPFTIIYRDYFHKGIEFFFGTILLGSSFPASWYLIALAIGIVIIALCDRGIGRWITPVIAVIGFLICVGQFTWRPVADQIGLSKLYVIPDLRFANNFVVSLLWIWVGRMFVRYQEKCRAVSMKLIIALFALSCVLLWAEHRFVYGRGWFTMNNDVYLAVMLAGPLFFWIILRWEMHLPNAKFYRCMSTLIYCIHATLAEIFRLYVIMPRFSEYELPWSLLCFVAVLGISLLLGWLILKGSEKIKILKYAY